MIEKVFDFIEFEANENHFETRCNVFAERAKTNTNWTLSQIIRFLQFQKES